MKKHFILLFSILFLTNAFGQRNHYWQQHVEYEMDINMDVSDFTFDGEQKLVYTNNSPDTISKVYYHLFFNAFQPGSQMDIRSRTIKDPDRRVGSRIFELEEKRSFLTLAVEEEYCLFMEHDAHNQIITLKNTEKGIRFGGSLSLKDL